VDGVLALAERERGCAHGVSCAAAGNDIRQVGLIVLDPPQQCTILDLEGADYIVALNEMEHRPLMSERFPNWESRIQYWKIGDVELVQPTKALALIDVQVDVLLASFLDSRTVA